MRSLGKIHQKKIPNQNTTLLLVGVLPHAELWETAGGYGLHRSLSPIEHLFSMRPQFESLDISSLWLTWGAGDQRGEHANVGSRKEEKALTPSGQALDLIYPLPSLLVERDPGLSGAQAGLSQGLDQFPLEEYKDKWGGHGPQWGAAH